MEAEAFLESKEIVNSDGSKIRIQDINVYYAHMQDFFSKDGWQFVMFATEKGIVNEQPLTINLDSRSISVPAAVASCASVQKDQLAEMLIFEVDRFFDIMDLSNTEIFVQWKTADREGDTKIVIIDFATKAGKLLFAWPLTDDITSASGSVKFSARFLVKNNAGEIIYSLNTQEASLTIKPALSADLNSFSIEPLTAGMFKDIVFNSKNAKAGKSAPHQPRFDAPGANIALFSVDGDGNNIVTPLNEVDNNLVANLVNDTVSFCAKAYTTDLGDIDYEWYYIHEDADGNAVATLYTIHDENNVHVRLLPVEVPAERLAIEGQTPNSNLSYYKMIADTDSGLTVPAPCTSADFPIEEGMKLYEMYSVFTIPVTDDDALTSDEVVGKYYVAAINHKGELSTEDTPVRSRECVLPGPAAIQIKTDLNKAKVVEKVVDAETNEVSIASGEALSIELPDNIYNADIVYNWLMKTTADGEYIAVTKQVPVVDEDGNTTYEEIIASTGSVLEVDKLGWYKAQIVSTLNRKDIDAYSEECKVTFAPEAPIIESDGDELYFELTPRDVSKDLKVKATVANSDNPLYSEGIEYVWFISSNSEPRELTEADADIAVANGDTLTVKYLDTNNAYMFNCIAYNILNERKASSGMMKTGFMITYDRA